MARRDNAEEARERQSFKLYFDMWPQFQEMTDEEAGKVLKACYAFILENREADFSGEDRLIRSFWKSVKLKLETQLNDRATKSENGRRAAAARWYKEDPTGDGSGDDASPEGG